MDRKAVEYFLLLYFRIQDMNLLIIKGYLKGLIESIS